MTDKPMTDSQIQQAIEDALIYGTGVIRMTHDDDGGVSVEPVDQKEIRIEEPQAKYGEWIPVGEMVPAVGVDVLTISDVEQMVAEFTHDGWCCSVDGYPIEDPTHWMPLPDPPEIKE